MSPPKFVQSNVRRHAWKIWIICLTLLPPGGAAPVVRAQGAAEANTKLITEISERAAFMEAWAAYCGAEAPATNAANERALREWKGRNRWAVFLARLEQQPKFGASFA